MKVKTIHEFESIKKGDKSKLRLVCNHDSTNHPITLEILDQNTETYILIADITVSTLKDMTSIFNSVL